jgi:ribosome-associated protein
MHDLQRLAERLAALAPAQLARIDLPEALREQIELTRRITAREGLRRQLQYLGRLMRQASRTSPAKPGPGREPRGTQPPR